MSDDEDDPSFFFSLCDVCGRVEIDTRFHTYSVAFPCTLACGECTQTVWDIYHSFAERWRQFATYRSLDAPFFDKVLFYLHPCQWYTLRRKFEQGKRRALQLTPQWKHPLRRLIDLHQESLLAHAGTFRRA